MSSSRVGNGALRVHYRRCGNRCDRLEQFAHGKECCARDDRCRLQPNTAACGRIKHPCWHFNRSATILLHSTSKDYSAGPHREAADRHLPTMPGVPAVKDNSPLCNVGVLLSTCTMHTVGTRPLATDLPSTTQLRASGALYLWHYHKVSLGQGTANSLHRQQQRLDICCLSTALPPSAFGEI